MWYVSATCDQAAYLTNIIIFHSIEQLLRKIATHFAFFDTHSLDKGVQTFHSDRCSGLFADLPNLHENMLYIEQ